MCVLLVPLGPLQYGRINLYILPNAIWQMEVTHYVPFGNFKYVHVIIDICFSFVYALTLSVDKAINAIKALKSPLVGLGVPWALKTDNGLTHASQQFNNFLGSRFFYTIGIPCNMQGQAIVEKINRVLKELLAKTISLEMRRDFHLVLTEVCSHINFLSFDRKGLSSAYKHWVTLPNNTALIGRVSIFLQWHPQATLLTSRRN